VIDTIEISYYTSRMAMGKRNRDRQPRLWIATTEFPTAASHPFYTRLNQLLREHGFDDFAEAQCATFYAETMGRPGLPGIHFRLVLIGYFEGIDSERGIAWRAADSLALRDFLGVGLEDAPPDHSTISRTRRLIDLETHRAVFTWVLQCLTTAGLVKGKTIGIDATTVEANAALRSIVRRDSGESYQDFLTKLARRPRALRRRRAPIWPGSIGSGRRRARRTIGPTRTTAQRASAKEPLRKQEGH
jgi:transposase